MERVVLKVSGKFVCPFDNPLVAEYASLIRETSDKVRLVVVVGGGTAARKYIQFANGKSWQDLVGIEIARVNAELLISHLGDLAYPKVPRSVEEFLQAYATDKVVVMGGLQPGQSTNAVSLIVAELINAKRVVNATTVDGVYDRNPKEPGARKLRRVTVDELIRILESEGWRQEPGRYELADRLSLEIAKRSSIPIYVVYGGDVGKVKEAILGKYFDSVIEG